MHRYLTRDSSGRLLIPAESSDGRRSDAWKAFVVVACVCPPSLWERVEKAAARKVSENLLFLIAWFLLCLMKLGQLAARCACQWLATSVAVDLWLSSWQWKRSQLCFGSA
jgi:hypothetical protein